MDTQTRTIRAAQMQDLPALLDLYRHLNASDPAMPAETAEARFAVMLAQPGMTVFIATLLDDVPIASVTCAIIPNLTAGGASYALIENVVTHADRRRKGHAGALIDHAVKTAWSKGCYKVMLLAGSNDPGVLGFYEGCGFTQSKTGFQIRRPL